MCLLDGAGNVLGTSHVEESVTADGPWSPARNPRSHEYSGVFRATPAWDASEAKALLGELDEAINDGCFSVLDGFQDKLRASGVRLTLAADGSLIPAWSIMLYDERVLEWRVEIPE